MKVISIMNVLLASASLFSGTEACLRVRAIYSDSQQALSFLAMADNGDLKCTMPTSNWPKNANMLQDMRCTRTGWNAQLRDYGNGNWAVFVDRAGGKLSFTLDKKCLRPGCSEYELVADNYNC